MWVPLILLAIISAAKASFLDFPLQSSKARCPPAEQLHPCTCTDYSGVTVTCKDVDDKVALVRVFSKPDWNLERVHFDNCSMDYIPSPVIKFQSLQQLNVSNCRLSALFEAAPESTPEFFCYLHNVTMRRGMQWELLKHSSIGGLGTFDCEIRHFGKDFKEYMPKTIKNLWFENAKTARITNQAFQNMVNLQLMTLTGGFLKTISRDMFPRPWNVLFWNMNEQKMQTLPSDLFDDMPQLMIFSAMRNSLITIDESIFTKGFTTYFLNDNPIECSCDVKWITTTGKESFKRFIGKCKSPESLSGKELKKLTEDDFSFCQ